MIDLPENVLMEHADQVNGSVILVTGGAAGFGKGLAELAAKYGAKVVLADIRPDQTLEVVNAIRASAGECSAPADPVDVTSEASLRIAFDHCVETYGRPPDIVYANAGVSANDWFEEDGAAPGEKDRPRAPRNRTLAVNLAGALRTAEMAQGYWTNHPAEAGRTRRLVMMSSMGGISGIPLGTMYSASKHAIMGYWKGVCDRLASGELSGFQCHVICPFFANTGILSAGTLAALAGVPLVPADTVGKTMVYAGSRPPTNKHGVVIMCLDDGDPVMADPDGYDPLSNSLPAQIRARFDRRLEWKQEDKGVWADVWAHVARKRFGMSGSSLFIAGCAVIAGLVGAMVLGGMGINRLSLPVAASTGLVLGIAGRVRSSGMQKIRRGRSSETKIE